MSERVVYACPCLNIKLHLSNKYILESHQDSRIECFKKYTDPPLEGWSFELGMGGVQAEYNTLMKTRSIRDWITVSCLNCATDNVYSVRTSSKSTTKYPIDLETLCQAGDQVLIHRDTIFGHQLESIRKRTNFSSHFGIMLMSDATPLPDGQGLEETSETAIPGELYGQHKQLCKTLESSLENMRAETEKRIAAYREEEMTKLEQASARAKYDRKTIWHKILQVSRAVLEEEGRENTRSPVPRNDDDKTETSSRKETTNRVHFAGREEATPSPGSNPSRSSAPSTSTPSSFRRPSFVLDEHLLSANTDSSTRPRGQVYSPEGGDRNILHDGNTEEEEEDMFNLDEEIAEEESDEQEASPAKDSPEWTRRRPNRKYLSDEENEDDEDEDSAAEQEDNLSTSISAYATSVPIAISHGYQSWVPQESEKPVNPAERDPTSINEELIPNERTEQKSPSLQASSYVGYDHSSISDHAISRLFPPTGRRKSVAATGMTFRAPAPLETTIIGGSLDTRGKMSNAASGRKSSVVGGRERGGGGAGGVGGVEGTAETGGRRGSLRPGQDSESDAEEGPMIPPHILAASTYTDEAEELFGAIPRSSSGWRRQFE
ncbi:hypothetical protein BCR43DRAFT_561533 [Syncephalastrum racemosum]|uniref:Uncharacterized protein n=1 Tax=Syncephalastrum racemosum TaxID=13706 RepID=A0A1X2HQS7_SYNRA|nr:hypothetical protein BCR43DRAFT_561533 [Syncephalastrum racemosum]